MPFRHSAISAFSLSFFLSHTLGNFLQEPPTAFRLRCLVGQSDITAVINRHEPPNHALFLRLYWPFRRFVL